MRMLKNHLIGVDQGTCNLFSDFENGGEMWSGNGARERRVPVQFGRSYRSKPTVHVSLDMWDMEQNANQRADISTDNVSLDGFDIIFKTWGDTKIARVRAAWLAIGEMKAEDEWDV